MPQFLDRLPETRRPRLWLTLLCLLLWLPGFFTLPPGDRDESRFAQASRQMVESGDWVRIRNQEEERNKKPVGIYWAQAASAEVLGAAGLPVQDSIWTYRIPSALGAWLAVLATFQFGRALVGRRAAFLGAALLASAVLLCVEAHIAKTDAALLATVATTMGLLGRAYLSPDTFTRRHAAAFWVVLGIGILLKGPIGPMIPLLTGITLLVTDRRAPWFRALRPLWGLPLALLVCVPWLVAIGVATEGRFFAEAVGHDMLGKVGSSAEAHGAPPGTYLLIFGLTAFPGAFLVLRAIPGAWKARLQPATRFLLAWAVPNWIVFEAVSTKLPHYVLPVFPALMLLGATWAMDPLRRVPPRWLAGLGWLALLGVAAGLAVAAPAVFWLADHRVDGWSLLGIPFAAVLAWRVLHHAREGGWARAGLAAVLWAIPLQWVVMQATLPRLEAPWVAPHLAAALDRAAATVPGGVPRGRVGLLGFHEPSAVFALGTPVRLLDDGAEAARFLGEGRARGETRLLAVEAREQPGLDAAAAAAGERLEVVGSVEGFNYTRGRRVLLRVIRLGA
ncbi:ArnT family glycosyltransferase [Roseomonas elaeocarpi]|uniref:ArnT family glycosyltransferase n=1 Tax=Roseomonas elaeocarpi TaxID=907779 RepID=A0ABV6JSC6_9PROT